MKKRISSPTRKRTALRRCAWLAALVVLASVLGIYNFVPVQAVWEMADVCDIQHPKTVSRFYDGTLPVTRFAVYNLMDGDDAMLLCRINYHPLTGWYGSTCGKAETWNSDPLHGGIYGETQGGKRICWFYGRVDDRHIQRLSLERTVKPVEGEPFTEVWDIPSEDLFEKNGKWYVLTKLDMEPRMNALCTYRLMGVTDSGQIVSSEVESSNWSTS